jgi:hypothetical protein
MKYEKSRTKRNRNETRNKKDRLREIEDKRRGRNERSRAKRNRNERRKKRME